MEGQCASLRQEPQYQQVCGTTHPLSASGLLRPHPPPPALRSLRLHSRLPLSWCWVLHRSRWGCLVLPAVLLPCSSISSPPFGSIARGDGRDPGRVRPRSCVANRHDPLAALLGYLTFMQLYIVAFAVGTLAGFFSLASVSLLPSLVKVTPDRAAWLAAHWAERRDDGQWHILGDAAHKRVNPVLYRKDEVLEGWKRIVAPTLWIEGDETDPNRWWGHRYPRSEFDARIALVNNLRRVRLPSCGHMLHFDQPQALAEALEAILRPDERWLGWVLVNIRMRSSKRGISRDAGDEITRATPARRRRCAPSASAARAREHRLVVDVVADEHRRAAPRARAPAMRRASALSGAPAADDVDDALAAEARAAPGRCPAAARSMHASAAPRVRRQPVVQRERVPLSSTSTPASASASALHGDAVRAAHRARCARRATAGPARDPRRRGCRRRSAARSPGAGARRRRCGR